MKRVHVHLTEQQVDRLWALSQTTGLNASEHMRRAVDLYLDSQEGKIEQKTGKQEDK